MRIAMRSGALLAAFVLTALVLAGPRSAGRSAVPAEARSSAGPVRANARLAWHDYDGDGRLDAYAILSAGHGGLLHGEGDGTLRDVTRAAGLTGVAFPRSASWADGDGDGRAELCLETAEGSLVFGHRGDGVFRRREDSGAAPPAAAAFAAPIPPAAGAQAAAAAVPCAARIADETGGCLEASSAPTLGRLYPISTDLFVAATGQVVLNGTVPGGFEGSARLTVEGLDELVGGYADFGTGAEIRGGGGLGDGGTGVIALGGESGYGNGGVGAEVRGGSSLEDGDGGAGLVADGGYGGLEHGGAGAIARGGAGRVGGHGLEAAGGASEGDPFVDLPGSGVVARGAGGSFVAGTGAEVYGGDAGGNGLGGPGLRAVGGTGYTGGPGALITGGYTQEGVGGPGIVVEGGFGKFATGGTGIVAQGGIGELEGGTAILATGGTAPGSPVPGGGTGLIAIGGAGTPTGTGVVGEGGIGVLARSADGLTGAALVAEGRVGIGTSTPGSQLHVVDTGSAVVVLEADTDDDDETDNARIEFLQDGGQRRALVGWDAGSETDNTFRIYATAGVNPVVIGTDDTERLRVTHAGNVGIGTSTPSVLLEVAGAAAKPGGGAWSVASDARLKRDVRCLEGALETLLALRGVRFEYVDPAAIGEREGGQIGFVAQEVETVLPDWVEDGADGYKRLSIHGFEALAVEALRELRATQEDELARLRAENDELRARLERLERRLGAEGTPAGG